MSKDDIQVDVKADPAERGSCTVRVDQCDKVSSKQMNPKVDKILKKC